MIDDPALPSGAWLPANIAFGWLAFDDPSAAGNILDEFKRISPEIDRLCRNYRRRGAPRDRRSARNERLP